MNLPGEETQLFFRLFFGLLAYANRTLKVVPKLETADDIRRLGSQRVVEIWQTS